ncbi:FAD-dependent oxidoreductase [Bradyrhizobium ontarionense]|uniref:Tryptophan 2-monooxygenase n=1 Tax=Bradyrhizobium ontarionense TaxID=2898149 RepID=A0ABY3RKN3_9BRAD|nr:FAD-dependent oxidoreductase [Bradyrhizobium sp. A19]UFZ08026.1 FAD-dependent oxidoreductase [Bradyrhizobium sp. A19]
MPACGAARDCVTRTDVTRKSRMSSKDSDSEILDVAVIGAGVSGVYSAWRLASCKGGGTPLKAKVFETSGRVGGRLLSVTPPGIPGTRVELGGMRFTSSHTRVKVLLEQFGIPTHPFPVREPQNICYVRGHRLRHQDLKTPALIPYNLLSDEQTPRSLDVGFVAVSAERVLRSMQKRCVDLAKVDWKDLAERYLYDGVRLRDLPLHYLLQRNVSDEALRFADDVSGYNSILYTWNAADGFPWNLDDFGRDVKYFGITPGFASLPTKLAKGFEDAGGQILFKHRLESFDVGWEGDRDLIEMQFAVDGDKRCTIKARKLILAMPRRSLELIAESGAVLGRAPENDRVRNLIRSVTPIPLFKLALGYRFPWWETIDPVAVVTDQGTQWRPIRKGVSITDLPLRQCYYWATDPDTGNAVVLIYDDGRDLEYWAGLRERRESPAYSQRVTEGGDAEWNSHKAPELMVNEVHRQLLEIHGVDHRKDIPFPYAAAYRDWSEDPFGGGANFWHLHVDSEQVGRDILQPKPSLPVFICGEAYSHQQGWVEGALQTADQMLATHFALPPPS